MPLAKTRTSDRQYSLSEISVLSSPSSPAKMYGISPPPSPSRPYGVSPPVSPAASTDCLLPPSPSTEFLLQVIEESPSYDEENRYLKADNSKPRPPPLKLNIKERERIIIKPMAPVLSRIPSSISLIIFAVVSFIFTGALSFAFVGERGVDVLRDLLDEAAPHPGIMLLGESVDVDVDEPSITVRWSLVACGPEFVLNGSTGVHGNPNCGLPSQNITIFIDDAEEPAFVYTPTAIPFLSMTGIRRHIQALSQFDADYVLDVHEAHLYPVDRYSLSSTVFAINTQTLEPIPIQSLRTIQQTTSFSVNAFDTSTYHALADGTHRASRELFLNVQRPAASIVFVFALWALNWLLAHAAVGLIILTVRNEDYHPGESPALAVLAILLAIPKLRESMPDEPGLDGVLIDAVGYFPQMTVCGLCAVLLLFLAAKREMDWNEKTKKADHGSGQV